MPSVPKKKDSSFGVATTVIKQKSKAVPPKKNIFGNIKKNQPKTEAQERMAASQAGKNYRRRAVKGSGTIGGSTGGANNLNGGGHCAVNNTKKGKLPKGCSKI